MKLDSNCFSVCRGRRIAARSGRLAHTAADRRGTRPPEDPHGRGGGHARRAIRLLEDRGASASGGLAEPVPLLEDRLADHEFTAAALDVLNERDRLILELRYGLTGEDPLDLADVGRRIGGISRENVEELLKRGAKRIAVGSAITASADVAAETAWFVGRLK